MSVWLLGSLFVCFVLFFWHVLLSRPIGGQKKTFEELLEEQLRLEEQRLKSDRQQQVREYSKART